MKLYIVYGSESSLLTDLYNDDKSLFIRYFNKNRIQDKKNCIFVNSQKNLKKSIDDSFKENKITKVIFIGAAFLSQASLFINMDEDKINKLISVNIQSYVSLTHLILPYMLKIKSGHFIYLSSFRSTVTSRGISLYSASKAFGEKFFEIIGKEYGSFGVYSSSIRMGYFDGRMTNNLPIELQKSILSEAGNRKLGGKKDLTNAIEFIEKNPYTNGGVLDLTGGINHKF